MLMGYLRKLLTAVIGFTFVGLAALKVERYRSIPQVYYCDNVDMMSGLQSFVISNTIW